MRDFDDIPMAVRDTPRGIGAPSIQRRSLLGIVVGLSIVSIVLGALLAVGLELRKSAFGSRVTSEAIAPNAQSRDQSRDRSAAPTGAAGASSTKSSSTEETEAGETLLGHLPYTNAIQDNLVALSGSGGIQLQRSAAEAFSQMQGDARAAGIELVPLSGYRSIEDQKHLFFEVKRTRNQTAAQRANVSAPPGYSEHHTGYAIDIGDAAAPSANLNEDFEQTKAFEWLQANAAKHSFELSFPRDNPQGITYEPWHWRFVGDQESLELFYKARQLSSSPVPATSQEQTTETPLPSSP